jgi:signal transduction histidine kinase
MGKIINPIGLGPDADHELLVRSLRAALEDAKKAKSAFLASVSHELRTPLNAILGYAQMISQQPFGATSDPRYAEYARDIETSAHRLLEVLSEILDMAQLESGKMRVFCEEVKLTELVDEVLALLRSRHKGASAPVEVRIDAVFPSLWTDRRRLQQIITNLISNAMSFTPPEGKITIFGHFAPSGDLEIAVKDSGAGMTPDEAKRAATRFGHAEDELARKHQGIGLGIPLTKSLTELLGGRMRIESSKGEGTIVTLDFPLNAVAAPVTQISRANNMSARMRHLLSH